MSKKKKIYIKSMGCKVNLADAASIVDLLGQDFFELVDEPGLADGVVLNTCTVTHKADRDCRKFLGSLSGRFPDLPVIVTGCGAVNQKEKFEEYPNVKKVFTPGNAQDIAKLLGMERQQGLMPQNPRSSFSRLGRKRAFVKVQDGCDARCTYCTIPLVRGQQRSMQKEWVISEVKRLLDAGHKELVLTGIHLGRYGTDLSSRTSLAELLDAIAVEFRRRVARVRLSSVEPQEWTDELLESISRHEFVCRHFHVPLQSGDPEILKRMARPYTPSQYHKTIDKLRKVFPQASIGADVLVGFPGETDKMADTTEDFVDSLALDYLHVFTFSSRPGTRAATMEKKVADITIKERAKRLRNIGRNKWNSFTCSGLGKFHMLLGEKVLKGHTEGKSEHYRKLKLLNTNAVGNLVKVRAVSQQGDELLCTVVIGA